jgi:patatin-like phospholipase/acyl hydrolase
MKCILALDGGGIRGIIPALFCAKLESWGGLGICELFDLIAGTSTGGIIALGLTNPTGHETEGIPSHRLAESILALYEQHGNTIFAQPRPLLVNLFRPRFNALGIESVLNEHFGESKLSDSVKPVLITSYDIEMHRPRIFKSWKAHVVEGHNATMAEIARAASAAPIIFPPTRVGGRTLVDGGIFANNPSMIAYAEARRLWPSEDDFLIVSIGTGMVPEPHYYEKTVNRGIIGWGQSIIGCIFDGTSDANDYVARQIIPSDRYFRFQCELGKESGQLDNAKPANIMGLKTAAERLFNSSRPVLEKLMPLLTSERSPCPWPDQKMLYK